jgi:hypothetical protein
VVGNQHDVFQSWGLGGQDHNVVGHGGFQLGVGLWPRRWLDVV